MIRLLELSPSMGWSVYFLGATDQVLTHACQVAQYRYPGLYIAGFQHGYFSEAEETMVVENIRKSKADILLVAMPSPKKEAFLARYHRGLGIPFTMGVGGSLDVLAGQVRRAPIWMQHAGMEWLYRLLQEPRRLFWRYAKTNSLFALWLAKEWVLRRRLQRSP
jgi:N-acetylglucosaminyldiphosphoundecaprenol N-acetyl-beta-D-mannosaminyltransferase